jgi:hypothetical protein
MNTKVTEDQFEWCGDKLIHVPTGASFEVGSDFINYGRAGDVLPDGRDFAREDVRHVARRLVAEKVRQRERDGK